MPLETRADIKARNLRAEDDWTVVTDQVERKRRQNRIAQRKLQHHTKVSTTHMINANAILAKIGERNKQRQQQEQEQEQERYARQRGASSEHSSPCSPEKYSPTAMGPSFAHVMPYNDISTADIMNTDALHQPTSWNESSIWMPRLADAAIQGNLNTVDNSVVGPHTSGTNSIEVSLMGQGSVPDTPIEDPGSLPRDLQSGPGSHQNEARDQGNTALHEAVLTDQLSIVRLLLQRGANPDAMGEQQQTPLHAAAERGFTHSVHTLVNSGAKVNLHDGKGLTALHLAARNGHGDVVALLLDAGANIDYQIVR
ncbi:uncharacterized protein BP5553_01691 [Venustampulla echinocandica]|uniref:Uncharacterized protein n=1 Tax=Venustampulla echinocandica TaxID=2656787 RepID=A0A370U1Q1_9HELO|nr:uncharacterized protein BP5553_01691 [Venustampulla echinocandica]RDL41712.1 hypothetical protein BP5553_01691 [Venustampulla echinocandica]